MKNRVYHLLVNPLKIYICLAVLFALPVGCNTEDDIQDDPYGGGKEPYGIRLLTDLPTPDRAYPGDEVVYKAQGLSNWFDQQGNPDFEFYISNEKAEILAATDTTVTVKVPENLSSGIAHIVVKEQVFYGPKLTILGNVSVDKGYVVEKPINGAIYDYLEHCELSDHYHWVGNFIPSLMGNQANIYCIAWVDDKGNVAGGWNATYYCIDSGQGIGLDSKNPNSQEGNTPGIYVNSINYFNKDMADGRPTVLVSGKFTQFHPVAREQSISVNHMMKVRHGIGMMYTDVQLPSIKGGYMETIRIPQFNGGTKEPPVATFVTSDGYAVAVGNITQYCKIDLDRSYSDDLTYEYTPVNSVMRMNSTGELDEIFRANKIGVSGIIQDAYMDEEDGIVLVGNIISFDGVSVSNILRLDREGNVDREYLRNVGTGANGTITKIRYNKNRKKAMIVGQFDEFNGVACPGVAMINSDGTLDESFKPRTIEGGKPNFACILDKHDIIVMSGTFSKYDGVTRRGFLMLTTEGEAMQKFNVPGLFLGELNHVIETMTSTNDNGLLLLGNFCRFNGEAANNAIKIEVDFD